jgi:hypothetical protein
MMDASRSAAADVPLQSSQREADLPLPAAVHELFSGLRAGAADVVDLVAAEAHVALRQLTVMVLSAVGASVLGALGLAGLVAALATELVAWGMPPSLAISIVATLCLFCCALLILQLRALSRRVLFGISRAHLRGER